MDDFQTADEGSISNPNAMGFMLGAGAAMGSHQGLARSESGPAVGGGLKARVEAYLASTNLYLRRINASATWSEEETFRNRYMFQNCSALSWQTIERYFADPLEPDTIRPTPPHGSIRAGRSARSARPSRRSFTRLTRTRPSWARQDSPSRRK